MTSEKPEWFQLTEGDTAPVVARAKSKKLPIAALVVAGAVILGGSLFANASDEPSASAAATAITSPSTSTSATTIANSAISGTPAIASASHVRGGHEGKADDGQQSTGDQGDGENESD